MRIIRSSTLFFQSLLAFVLGGGAAVVSMQATAWGPWPGVVLFLLVLIMGLRRPLRRWRVARQVFPSEWRAWLEARVPFYEGLDASGRAHFERDVQFFLDEYRFEGVRGVEVTDALRLGVAAGVALLLHGRPDWELPAGRTLLLYPGRFDENYHGGRYADYDGMVHEQGPILLSAPAVTRSWDRPDDGSNVVIHELAHLFDFENMSADGVPSLINPSSEEAWRKLVRKEMRRIRRGHSLLRGYGATAPSEFFAVAVEVFIEQPDALHAEHPELFEALRAFFNFDPRPERKGRKEERMR